MEPTEANRTKIRLKGVFDLYHDFKKREDYKLRLLETLEFKLNLRIKQQIEAKKPKIDAASSLSEASNEIEAVLEHKENLDEKISALVALANEKKLALDLEEIARNAFGYYIYHDHPQLAGLKLEPNETFDIATVESTTGLDPNLFERT